MQFGVISLMLAVTAFVGILLWTFSKGKKSDFEEAARIPMEDGDDFVIENDNSNVDEEKKHQQKVKSSGE